MNNNAFIIESHRSYGWHPDVICGEENFQDKLDEIDAQVQFLNIDVLKNTSKTLKSFCVNSGDGAGFGSANNTKEEWIKRLQAISTVLNLG